MIESRFAPAHPHAFEALLNEPFAGAFHQATTDWQAGRFERLIVDMIFMGFQVIVQLGQALTRRVRQRLALRSSGSFTESASMGTPGPAESQPAASLCSHSIMHFVSPEQENAAPFGRRPKLWQLKQELHCTVIGTCVPIRELRAIYRRVRGPAAKTPSDYELHHLFVPGCG